MDPIITTKLGAVKRLAENMVDLAENDDYEGAANLADELHSVAQATTPKVVIKDCPMSPSGIIIEEYREDA